MSPIPPHTIPSHLPPKLSIGMFIWEFGGHNSERDIVPRTC